MALTFSVNQQFATTDFSPTWGCGEIPVVETYYVDDLPSPSTQVYKIGTLLYFDTVTGNVGIYDSTAQSTKPFKGVFFDEMAVQEVAGVQPGAVEVAISDRPSTLWLYSNFNGANTGTTDIDYLVTNGFANIVYKYINGTQTKFVQFKGMGTGA
jgi:hypothetical protein